jgi:hypothetical protein
MLVLAPWLLSGGGTAASLNNLAVGLLLITLSIPRDTNRQRSGTLGRLIVS